MNLLKKLTSKKTVKENYFNFYLNDQISNLKLHILDLSNCRRKDQKNLRIEKVKQIFRLLDNIESLYLAYLKELANIKAIKQNNLAITEDTEEKIIFMTEKKKSLRQEFEKIYINFKHTAIHLEDIPMNNMLKRMRKAFNFESKQTHINTIGTRTIVYNSNLFT
jgi:DNA repair exonuclease SbcCD nuclease subunit